MLKGVLVASALGLSALMLSAVGTPSTALPAVGLEAPSGMVMPIAWRGHHGRFHVGPRYHRFGHFRRGRVFYGGPAEGSTDVAALKTGALQVLALDYRSGFRPRASKISN